MADGGWEHIRGVYVTQHLIEGGKDARERKIGKMQRGGREEE